MKKILYAGIIALILAMALGTTGTAQAQDITIGVLAKRGAKKCLEKWGDTGKYLQNVLGVKATILPLAFTEIEPKVQAGEVDFILANSAFYVELNKKHGARAVATMVNSRQNKALDQFGGVIIVKQDSPIQTLSDLKGKKFMCVKYSSFGGGQMAWRHLLDNGIDPKQDFAAFPEGKKHDNVVLAVRAGAVDAGTVRSDTLERMQAEGLIDMNNFRILDKAEDDFPFVHSTRLYPEWPMAATAQTPAETVQAVGKALQGMAPDAPAAISAKIVGWVAPLDYAPVVECLKAIKYGAFAE